MGVFLTFLLSLILFWVFASKNFAINMTILWAGFWLVELGNKIVTGTTISGSFWKWQKTEKPWKVWLVASTFILIGVFFTLHLTLGI